MPLFLVQLTPTRKDFVFTMTDAEREAVGAHFEYLKSLLADGKLVCAGRTNEAEPTGIAILDAGNPEEAAELMGEDPAITSGVFNGKVAPFDFALADDVSLATLVESSEEA